MTRKRRRFKTRIPGLSFSWRRGLSFSWKRALGLSRARYRIARKTGIPTTRTGIKRKLRRKLIEALLRLLGL